MGRPVRSVSPWARVGSRAGVLSLVLSLGGPGAAWAAAGGRDDCAPCTRHARAEYEAAHAHSKQLAQLDCAGLTAYAEGMRLRHNRQVLSTYLRPPASPAHATEAPPSTLLNNQPAAAAGAATGAPAPEIRPAAPAAPAPPR